jgi:hypothetical protein
MLDVGARGPQPESGRATGVPTTTVVTVDVRPYVAADRDAVLELSLRAWEPVFDSLRAMLGPSGVFGLLHPDWRVSQRAAVGDVLDDTAMTVWVAVLDGAVVGFAAAALREGYGEVVMLAVDPTRPAPRRRDRADHDRPELDHRAGCAGRGGRDRRRSRPRPGAPRLRARRVHRPSRDQVLRPVRS